MKIVIATPLYPPEIGGPATYAKILFEGLPKKGIEVELVKFNDVRHFPKFVRNYIYSNRVLKAARAADVVLALDPVSTGLPALRAAKKAKKPFVVKIVGDYAWEQGRQRFGVAQNLDEFVKTKRVPFPVSLFRRLQTHVARNAIRIIVPSEYLKNIVIAWGIQREKIEVIHNAVTIDGFDKLTAGKLGTIPKEVVRLSRPLIITAGRLVPWKNADNIIDAVANIPGTSIVIIGDGPERAALARRAGEKLSDRVIFTGTLSHRDTLATIKSADVFVLNSSYEGLSHLLIEALVLGVPIIATRVGGNSEVIIDGKDGLLIPTGDTPALSEALTRILSDEALRARLSARAIESAKRFSVDAMLSATEALLQKI
jgi:glycosyltransferase involved in cell wall biosynthesis